jgi:hypothetical protein
MTAIKTSGLGDKFFVDGYDLSGDTQQLGRIGGGPAVIDQTDITQSAHARTGTLLGGEINWTSYFDKGAGQAHAALSGITTADRIVTYAHQPGTLGSAAASHVCKQIGYDPNRGNDASLTVGVASQSTGYPLEWGQALTAGIRTDTAATNGTALDFGAVSTLFGLQAYLHVFAVTGTSVTVKLQDSADNSTFADITSAAFVAATTSGAQRLQTGRTATVRRYVRVATTGTFSNAQFFCHFVRNATAMTF